MISNRKEYKAKWRLKTGRANMKARMEANTKIIDGYLKTHVCVDCGETDPIVLEFDHVRGIKKFEVSKAKGLAYAEKTVLAEIALCVIRCANCHRIKTGKEYGFWWTDMHKMQIFQGIG